MSSQKISFHSESNGGRIEYSATNVVALRCLSRPHVIPKAYIDGREQHVKDGVGLIIHRQKQHKQVREHGGSHSHRRETALSYKGWTALYHCGGRGGTIQACSTQVILDEDHVPMSRGKAQVRYEQKCMV